MSRAPVHVQLVAQRLARDRLGLGLRHRADAPRAPPAWSTAGSRGRAAARGRGRLRRRCGHRLPGLGQRRGVARAARSASRRSNTGPTIAPAKRLTWSGLTFPSSSSRQIAVTWPGSKTSLPSNEIGTLISCGPAFVSRVPPEELLVPLQVHRPRARPRGRSPGPRSGNAAGRTAPGPTGRVQPAARQSPANSSPRSVLANVVENRRAGVPACDRGSSSASPRPAEQRLGLPRLGPGEEIARPAPGTAATQWLPARRRPPAPAAGPRFRAARPGAGSSAARPKASSSPGIPKGRRAGRAHGAVPGGHVVRVEIVAVDHQVARRQPRRGVAEIEPIGLLGAARRPSTRPAPRRTATADRRSRPARSSNSPDMRSAMSGKSTIRPARRPASAVADAERHQERRLESPPRSQLAGPSRRRSCRRPTSAASVTAK